MVACGRCRCRAVVGDERGSSGVAVSQRSAARGCGSARVAAEDEVVVVVVDVELIETQVRLVAAGPGWDGSVAKMSAPREKEQGSSQGVGFCAVCLLLLLWG